MINLLNNSKNILKSNLSNAEINKHTLKTWWCGNKNYKSKDHKKQNKDNRNKYKVILLNLN
jgi:hypothetical protein